MAHQTRTGNTRGRKAPPARGRQAERLEFVQDYIPIKDLRNGIVETTDGRYLKILEIEPINFLLRSNEEQWGIISTFASWLKISPMRLQFKSVTRKADSDRYVAGLEADIEKGRCARLPGNWARAPSAHPGGGGAGEAPDPPVLPDFPV